MLKFIIDLHVEKQQVMRKYAQALSFEMLRERQSSLRWISKKQNTNINKIKRNQTYEIIRFIKIDCKIENIICK